MKVSLFSSTSNSSDSSSDEEDNEGMIYLLIIKNRLARNSIPNFVEEVEPNYREQEFKSQFHIGINVYERLVNQFENSDAFKILFNNKGGRPRISAEKHILIFLYFVGHEAAGYREVNNIFDLSLSTLHCVINRIANFICTLGPQVIKWPNENEIVNMKEYFHRNKQIPDVVGIIDGSHIRIDKPLNDSDSYINRKGYYSIQMQGIVDHRKKFTDIYIGYPGSVHDARVFKNSSIYNNLPQLCYGGYILGNSAYPLMNTLLTPYKDNGHMSEEQKYFNQTHSFARIYVEHTFGILKQRFRQLYHLKLRNPRLIVQVIKACCILHNITDEEELEILDEPLNDDMQNECDTINNDENVNGRALRNDICSRLWDLHNV